MLIPILAVFVMFGHMRHRRGFGGWDHGHGRRRSGDAIEEEYLLAQQAQEDIQELERRVAELESGLDFAERLLVTQRPGTLWPGGTPTNGLQDAAAVDRLSYLAPEIAATQAGRVP